MSEWNPVLLILRWAISPPAMWKSRTDFTQRITSVQRRFKADHLQRLPRRSAVLRALQDAPFWENPRTYDSTGSGSAPRSQKKKKTWIPPSDELTHRADVNSHVPGASRYFLSLCSLVCPWGRSGKHSAQNSPQNHLSSCFLFRSSCIAAEVVVPRCRTYIDCRGASVPGRSRCCWRTRLWLFLEKHRNEAHFSELLLRLLLYFF